MSFVKNVWNLVTLLDQPTHIKPVLSYSLKESDNDIIFNIPS